MAVQIYGKVGDAYKLNVADFNTVLNKVEEDLPIAVLSVCGPLRQGKSFLLSVFLRFLKSGGKPNWIREPLEDFFKFRSGSKPETTGIYIWGEPFILTKFDGTKVALLLVDSQGTFDNQTTTDENGITFGLCSLLSSHLIFNVKNQIGEETLQFFQLFAGFARLASDETTQDDPFQKLMFLVRDFEHGDYPFGFYNDSVSIDGKNYKKDFIDPQIESPAQVKKVHESILRTFASVGVYLMPHPGQELARNGNFDLNNIDPEFVVHLEKLASDILNPQNIVPKVIGGKVVDGKLLKLLVSNWAKFFSQKLPETKTLFDSASEIQHEMAKQEAIKIHSSKLSQYIQSNPNGVYDNQLLNFHRQATAECVAVFTNFKKMKDTAAYARHFDAMHIVLQGNYDYYKNLNTTNRNRAAAAAVGAKEMRRQEALLAQQMEEMPIQEAAVAAERARLHLLMQQQAEAARIAREEAEAAQRRTNEANAAAATTGGRKGRGYFAAKQHSTLTSKCNLT